MAEHRIVLEQIRSAIRRPAIQGETLSGLKLGRIGRVSELHDTPATRGMIAKVKHLVRVMYTSQHLDEFVAEWVSISSRLKPKSLRHAFDDRPESAMLVATFEATAASAPGVR